MTRVTIRLLAAALVNLALSATGSAHPGGLNAEGCHHNRKTDDYHCHGAVATTPRLSTRRESAAQTLQQPAAHFQNCAQARAAGAAPIRRGEPGYRSGLDRDGDGIACE